MLSYSQILKSSYHITLNNPLLWLFGLFTVGSFNLSFFHFHNWSAYQEQKGQNILQLVYFFQTHPAVLAAVSAAVLLVSLVSLFITNWAKIMLVLMVRCIAEVKVPLARQQMDKSKGLLWPVVRLSLFTTALMVAVAMVLFGLPLFLVENSQLQTLLFELAVVIFLPLAFTISCLNIFSNFFMVLFKKDLWGSLNLATDFFVTKWTDILAFTALLAVIYSACFACGLAVIFLVKSLFSLLATVFPSLGISAIIRLSQAFSGLVVWLMVGALSAFANTALLQLFFELITPVEKQKQPVVVAPAAVD